MTEQQDVSVFVLENCAPAAIADGLRTQNPCDHPIGLHLHFMDDGIQDGLLRGARERICLD